MSLNRSRRQFLQAGLGARPQGSARAALGCQATLATHNPSRASARELTRERRVGSDGDLAPMMNVVTVLSFADPILTLPRFSGHGVKRQPE